MPTAFRQIHSLLDLEVYLSPSPEINASPAEAVNVVGEPLPSATAGPSDGNSTSGGNLEGVHGIYDFINADETAVSQRAPVQVDNPTPVPQQQPQETPRPEPNKVQFGDGLVCIWTQEEYIRTLWNPDFKKTPQDWRGHSQTPSNDGPLLSLDDSLDEFSKVETLHGERAWSCPRCKRNVTAQTSLQLWRVPEILILQLKRFDPARNRKVNVFVDYPVKNLDLTDRVGDKEWLKGVTKGERLVYDLFAIGEHSGGLYGGHYTANVYNYVDGNWYDFNGMPFFGVFNRSFRFLGYSRQPRQTCEFIRSSTVLQKEGESMILEELQRWTTLVDILRGNRHGVL